MPIPPIDYPSNFSNGTAVNSLGTFIQYANYASDGVLAYAVLIIIFCISFFGTIAAGSRKSTLSASFVTLIFSVYFFRLSMINPAVMFGLIVLMIVGLFMTNSDKGGY